MDSLDNKLRKILWSYEDNLHLPGLIDRAAEQIRQAFAEANYVRVPELMSKGVDGAIGYLVNGQYMTTGQEWYDRFKEVVDSNSTIFEMKPEYKVMHSQQKSILIYNKILAAARRAAGLEETTE